MKIITRSNAYHMSEHSSEPGFRSISVMENGGNLIPFSEAVSVGGRCHSSRFITCSTSTVDSLWCSFHNGSRIFIGAVRGL